MYRYIYITSTNPCRNLRRKKKSYIKPHISHRFHFQRRGEKVLDKLPIPNTKWLLLPFLGTCLMFALTIHGTCFTKERLVLCQTTSLLKPAKVLSCLQQNRRDKILLCHAKSRKIINHVAINREIPLSLSSFLVLYFIN